MVDQTQNQKEALKIGICDDEPVMLEHLPASGPILHGKYQGFRNLAEDVGEEGAYINHY